jgi:protein O-mannosyl-transferase
MSLAAALGAYAQFLFYGHISWDDPEMVFRNRAVRTFDAGALFSQQFTGNYIPFTMLLHAMSWAAFGANSGLHHLPGILIHLLNGWMVYVLGRRLLKSSEWSGLAAMIFLLHPLQVESVGWISELKNVVSACFLLGGMIFYLDFLEKKTAWPYVAALLLGVAGCLSKPSAVAFPLALISIDFFVSGKITKRDLLLKLPFLAIALVFGLINLQTQAEAQFINYSHAFPYWQRTAFAGFALMKYLQLFVIPVKLSVIYPYPPQAPQVFAAGFVFLALLAMAVGLLLKRRKNEAVALVFFITGLLVLVLQFIPFGEALYADRYMYLPLTGMAWLTVLLFRRLKLNPRVTAIVLLAILTSAAAARGSKWRDTLVLYQDILKKFPGEFIALNSAGVESMFRNQDAQALDYFNRAAAAAPRNYKSYYNRGLLFLKNNRPAEAIKSFNATLRIYDYAKAFTGRAAAYYMTGDLKRAMADAQEAIKHDPKNARAHFVLGNCHNDLNRLDEALSAYNRAIELNDLEADFYFKRAIAFGKKKEFRACMSDLDRCLGLDPGYSEAYYWRGVAKVNLKLPPCADFERAEASGYQPATNALNNYCR